MYIANSLDLKSFTQLKHVTRYTIPKKLLQRLRWIQSDEKLLKVIGKQTIQNNK